MFKLFTIGTAKRLLHRNYITQLRPNSKVMQENINGAKAHFSSAENYRLKDRLSPAPC